MRRKVWKLIATCAAMLSMSTAFAQQYIGTTGLIHTPTAFTAQEGEFRVGAHWINSHLMPSNLTYNGKTYNSAQFHAGLTAFSWFEFSYSFLLMKGGKGNWDPNDNGSGYNHKDQAFSAKVQALPEGKWWPAIAIGGNDIFTSAAKNENQHQANVYAAASKHIDLWRQRFGLTLAYRYWKSDSNARWNGLVGGIEYTPSFLPQTSLMAEWTGCDVNLGINATLWRHISLQASLLDGKWPSAGISFTGNLF